MPSFQTASYNSARVQHAWKINSIEQLKLDGRIQLLDKERRHRVRLFNQDMRLISLTLDYIQTSSGRSAEGLAADSDPEEEETQSHNRGPCFLYGERVVSRKRRRYLRPQSAFNKSLYNDAISSVSSANARPQSSPSRQKPAFITQIRDDQSETGTISECWSRSGVTTPKHEWDQEPSEITKILLRACSVDSNQRQSVFNRSKDLYNGRGSSVLKALHRNNHSNPQVLKSSFSPGAPRASMTPSNRISAIMNQGAPPMSAGALQMHVGNSKTVPMTTTKQRHAIMESKMAFNKTNSEIVQNKVKHFFKR